MGEVKTLQSEVMRNQALTRSIDELQYDLQQ